MGLLTGCGKGSWLHSLATWWRLWWFSCQIMCDPSNSTDCSPPGSSVHEISQAKILGSHFLLQGIFSSQGLNPHLFYLLHCRRILYHPSHQGSHLEPRTKIWPNLDPKAFHQGTLTPICFNMSLKKNSIRNTTDDRSRVSTCHRKHNRFNSD